MRVLVTRAEPEAGRTAALLAARGHEALVAPLLTPRPVAAAIPRDGLAAVVVTSPRTVRMMEAGSLPALRVLPTFAVGDRTAAALGDAGFADIRSAAGDVRALARLIGAAGLPAGSTLVHPGGEQRAGDLGAALREYGLNLVSPVVYRMESATALPDCAHAALAAGTLDAVLHYSPRSARVFADLAVAGGIADAALRPLHACLSPAVAEALEPLGAPSVVIAAHPDEPALLDALAARSGLRGDAPAR